MLPMSYWLNDWLNNITFFKQSPASKPNICPISVDGGHLINNIRKVTCSYLFIWLTNYRLVVFKQLQYILYVSLNGRPNVSKYKTQ